VAKALRTLTPTGQTRVPLVTLASQATGADGVEVSSKDVGAICRSFGFETKRYAAGVVVMVNSMILARILERYGLADAGPSEDAVENVESVGDVASNVC